jgi:hypothetical protein
LIRSRLGMFAYYKKRRVGGRTSHLARGDRVPIHLLTYLLTKLYYYSEVRARAPNGSQEVAARVRGGHVTARTRIGVQLGRLIDTVRRSRKEAG